MIELPRRGGEPYTIDHVGLAKLKADYPQINVELELKKMRNWLDANPRSLKRDVWRFIINWLNRARPQAASHVTRETSQHYAVVADRMARPQEPVRYAPPEVVADHLSQMRKVLGMRPR
jgi:hypothetical protein